MRQRPRKLIGTALLMAFVVFWALFAMSLTQGRVATLSAAMQAAAFVVLGLVWVLPAGLLIRWMSRPD
jgi:predicted branched-subunit amino acid permease